MAQYQLLRGRKAVNYNSDRPGDWEYLNAPNRDSVDPDLIPRLYKQVSWLYRGVNMRAAAVASMPFDIYRQGRQIDNPHDPKELGFRLNWDNLLTRLEKGLTLLGKGHWLIDKNRVGIDWLNWASPDNVSPVYNQQKGSLDGFTRFLDKGKTRKQDRKIGYSEKDRMRILYWWLPSVWEELAPDSSPAIAALSAASIVNEGNWFVADFFEGGGVYLTLVEVPKGTSEGDRQKTKNFFQRAFNNANKMKGRKVEAIRGELKVHHLQPPLDELEIGNLTGTARQEIATALGIPHTLLFSEAAKGLGGGGVVNNDRLNFYDWTIKPECDLIAASFNEQYLFPQDMELVFRPEDLEIYQQNENAKAEGLVKLKEAGIVTINEARDQLGYDPIPEHVEPLALPEPEPTPPPDNQPEILDAMESEVKAWEAFTIRRHGRDHRPFRAEVIPAPMAKAIQRELDQAVTLERKREIFDIASYALKGDLEPLAFAPAPEDIFIQDIESEIAESDIENAAELLDGIIPSDDLIDLIDNEIGGDE